MPFVLGQNLLGRSSIGFPRSENKIFKATVNETFKMVVLKNHVSVDVDLFEYEIEGQDFSLVYDDYDLAKFSAVTVEGDDLVVKLYNSIIASTDQLNN